jgi:hypothetical protein
LLQAAFDFFRSVLELFPASSPIEEYMPTWFHNPARETTVAAQTDANFSPAGLYVD